MDDEKQEVRQRVWQQLEERGAARFPGAEGRIPNFEGAADAARRLAETDIWKRARVLKCNPDSPQLPVRRMALQQGKVVYMAVPKLAHERCFIELAPEKLGDHASDAASISGAERHGRQVHPKDMPDIDLIVTGCVAVREDGARLGKGGGYSDLEYALGRELGLVDENVPIVTTVHEIQIVADPFPMAGNDISLDVIVTPERIIVCERPYRRPDGIDWKRLDHEKLEAIPILAQRRPE